MIANAQLHRIRTGEATPKEARTIIRDLIAKEGGASNAALYTALRAWTWKALQMRRFDDDMSEWFSVIKGTSAALSRRDQTVSHYLEALSHLVEESLRHAASHGKELLITRSHVGEILDTVNRHNGRAERERIREATGLSNSRLSQVLTELTIAGALEREKESRHASFILSDTGREMLEIWREARRAAPEAMESVPEPALQRNIIVDEPVRDEDDIDFMKHLTLGARIRRTGPPEAMSHGKFVGMTISSAPEIDAEAPNQRFVMRPPEELDEPPYNNPVSLTLSSQREPANA